MCVDHRLSGVNKNGYFDFGPIQDPKWIKIDISVPYMLRKIARNLRPTFKFGSKIYFQMHLPNNKVDQKYIHWIKIDPIFV